MLFALAAEGGGVVGGYVGFEHGSGATGALFGGEETVFGDLGIARCSGITAEFFGGGIMYNLSFHNLRGPLRNVGVSALSYCSHSSRGSEPAAG